MELWEVDGAGQRWRDGEQQGVLLVFNAGSNMIYKYIYIYICISRWWFQIFLFVHPYMGK